MALALSYYDAMVKTLRVDIVYTKGNFVVT